MRKLQALETLKSIPQWVCYDLGKLPKNPRTGKNAGSTLPDTWSDFMTAVKGQKIHNLAGLGWVFTEDSGIVGIDLDKCIDESGTIEDWAQIIVDSINSYTEISPSGSGLHIFVYGAIEKALGPKPGHKIEMYSKGRYFTVTGEHLAGTPEAIEDRTDAIQKLWQREINKRKVAKSGSVKSTPVQRLDLDHPYIKASYEAIIGELAGSTEGNRNDALNRAAFALGQFVEAGYFTVSEVEAVLHAIGKQLGLDDNEVEKTTASGLRAGQSSPRDWPDLTDTQIQKSEPESKPQPIIVPASWRDSRPDEKYHSGLNGSGEYVKREWGLTDETIERFKVGYCASCPTSPYSDSITIPFYVNGELSNVYHRLKSPNGQGNWRPDSDDLPDVMFNGDCLLYESDVIIVSGAINAMVVAQFGLDNVIGLPGKFRMEWLDKFSQVETAYIALDPEQRDTARKIGQQLSKTGVRVRVVSLPCKPREMLARFNVGLGQFSKYFDIGRPM